MHADAEQHPAFILRRRSALLAKMVEVDENSLHALRKAVAGDDVGATEQAMRGATDDFALGGLEHQRQTWDGKLRGTGHGISHDETPYYHEVSLERPPIQGDLQLIPKNFFHEKMPHFCLY